MAPWAPLVQRLLNPTPYTLPPLAAFAATVLDYVALAGVILAIGIGYAAARRLRTGPVEICLPAVCNPRDLSRRAWRMDRRVCVHEMPGSPATIRGIGRDTEKKLAQYDAAPDDASAGATAIGAARYRNRARRLELICPRANGSVKKSTVLRSLAVAARYRYGPGTWVTKQTGDMGNTQTKSRPPKLGRCPLKRGMLWNGGMILSIGGFPSGRR
jgi:hypothetical protein